MGTNAQRQAAFKARKRQAGKKQIAIWVDPQQEAAISAFLAGIAPLPVTSGPSLLDRPIPLFAPPRKPRKKRDTREPRQIRNDELWETHHAEIRMKRAAGRNLRRSRPG